MSEKKQDFSVREVEEVVPKELPLIIEPPKKGWHNEAQETFARVLNGYAYKNPTKWNLKKEALLDQLAQLKEAPGLLAKFQGSQVEGVEGSVSIKSQSAPKEVEQE